MSTLPFDAQHVIAQLPSGFGALTSDSRAVKAGSVFVAFPGTSLDGRNYMDQAIAQGASAVIAEARGYVTREHGVPVVLVENLRRWFASIVDATLGYPSKKLTLIGVTGTNGKTSVSTWIAQALDALGLGCGLIGTLGCGRVGSLKETANTTPDSATVVAAFDEFAKTGLRAATMEVSSHALDQERVHAMPFRIGVFTNLTRDHLDYHGSMEAYSAAKAKLFAAPTLDFAIINRDDVYSAAMERAAQRAKVLTYGATSADVFVRSSTLSAGAMQLRVGTPLGDVEVAPPLTGQFNVSNVLAVIATLGALGYSRPDIMRAVNALKPVRGRMQKIASNQNSAAANPAVFVDYAHTPDALEKALSTLRSVVPNGGALNVVFGCGGNRDAGKRALMGEIAGRLADRVWVTSDNPRNEHPQTIVDAIARGARNAKRLDVCLDRARSIARAIESAGADDVVLIAGKGHETYQEIEGVRHPFDDAAHAAEALCSK